MNVIAVLGKKPDQGEIIHPHYQRNLNKAVEIIGKENFDKLVISGGRTRKNKESEAKTGSNYLKGKVAIPIVIDEDAKSTVENVLNLKEMLEKSNISKLTLVVSKYHKQRVIRILKKLWPEVMNKVVLVNGYDKESILDKIIESIFSMYFYIDPKEQYLSNITKKIYRNK